MINSGKQKIGQVIGVNRSYITDGIWIRCDCGVEMLEILQDYDRKYIPAEYQFRFFSPVGGIGIKLNKKDIYWSCFVTHKNELNQIADFFNLTAFSEEQKEIHLYIKDEQSNYSLHCARDEELDLGDIMLENPKGKVIWDCVIKKDDFSFIANKMYEMIKREEGEQS